ncbi:MAG: CvpA family protein [Spirochaetales bacterium]|nr:CvpA family protein [Spirochaetales bacterium]
MSFEVIDIVFALIVVIAAIRGAFRGFVTEVGSMAALILGFAMAIVFYKPVALLLEKQFKPSMWNQLIAFLILFLLVYLLVKLVQRLLQNIIERLNLDRLDSALGLFLGITEGLLVVGVVLFVINWQPFFDPRNLLGSSFFARLLFPILPSPERIFGPRVFIENV